jgi:hypothetical protein
MKRLLVLIWVVFGLSSFTLACDNCEYFFGKEYEHKGTEQKHRFAYERREVRHEGHIALERAKNWQKVRNRYRNRYRYKYYYRR